MRIFRTTFNRKICVVQKNSLPLHPQSRNMAMFLEKQNGALVQLVRIHACHAWGHGFESRTHRKKGIRFKDSFFG